MQQWHQRVEQVAREDLVMFINACLACTGQREFYDDAWGQKVSIDFLHDYILGNYRLLYARTLAAGINHFNQAQIIIKLLETGRNVASEHRVEEGIYLAAVHHRFEPQNREPHWRSDPAGGWTTGIPQNLPTFRSPDAASVSTQSTCCQRLEFRTHRDSIGQYAGGIGLPFRESRLWLFAQNTRAGKSS